MAFSPEKKNPGDLIKSQDWNEAMNEIVRLEDDKVNRDGDTINGQLSINGNVGIGTTPTSESLEVNGSVKANTFTGESLEVNSSVKANSFTGESLEVNGSVKANSFTGSGANLTGLNGAQITSGTIPDARIPNAIARDSEVSAKFNTSTGHDHDGSNSKRISSGVKGWVRLPFMPKKHSTSPEFIIERNYSRCPGGGAYGVMEIPIPAGITKINRFRIAGYKAGKTRFTLYKNSWDSESNKPMFQDLLRNYISGAPFNELFVINQSLDPETDNISLFVHTEDDSHIYLIAAEFE